MSQAGHDQHAYGDQQAYGAQQAYGDQQAYRAQQSRGGDQQAYGAQQAYGDQQSRGGDQRAYGDQQSRGGDQRAYGDQQSRGGDQQAYGAQQAYGDQQSRGGDQQAYGAQQSRGGDHQAYGAQQSHGGDHQAYGAQQAYGGDQHAHGYGQVPYGQGPAVQTPGGQTPPPAATHAAYGQTPPPAPAPGSAAPEHAAHAAPAAPAAHAAYGQAPGAPGGDQQTQVFGTVAAAQPLPTAEPEAGAGAYGPATVTGNARVTDAQRARAEGRSPIIEPGMQPAALTALLGLLLAGGAAVGQYALLVPLVLLQAVTAAGWFRLNGMWPARQGIALAFAGGLAADAALLVTGRENAPAAILGTLGVWVLLTLVLQLRSHAAPDERMYGLMATVASAALAIVATGHLAADPDAVTVGAVAVAVAVLARALPLPTPASVAVALLAAAGAGIAVGGMTDMGSKGALLGLGAGVCALIGHRVASYDYPSRFVHMTAGVALPLAAAAPAVYLLGRVVG
ncbi:hypothetical protein ACFWVU_04585 [Streptomyces sp. NPDC058686]|uniref:hypothetical protein n=1 Tax=Streptomyces sp. NPDC058686 TaxID=3346599 RepID=UPI00365D370D